MAKNITYNETVYILSVINIRDTFIKAYIHNINTHKTITIKNKETLNALILTISEKTPKKQTTRIYHNKVANIFKPDYKNISYAEYNDILPNYSSYLPADFNEEYCINKIENLAKEIKFYIDKIGLNKFKKKHKNAGFGGIAARCLEQDYPDLINPDNALEVIKRSPNTNFITILSKLKKYGANCIISNFSDNSVYSNVVKFDIDSSFTTGAILQKTMINLRNVNKTKINLNYLKELLLNSDKGFIIELKLNQQPTLKHHEYPDLLIQKNLLLGTQRMPKTVTLTHLGFKHLLRIYNLNLNLIEIKQLIVGDLVDYLPFQKEIYKRLHRDKSYYKNIGNILEKNRLKKTTHCLHGRGQLNAYNNLDTYNNKWKNHKGQRHYEPADYILNYMDSVMLYEYARDSILNIIDLCIKNHQHIYYYDTDCVVVPNNLIVKMIQNRYNEFITECYKNSEYNIEDYTHFGHTIGKLEQEIVYDKFTYKHGKFYLYEVDGKLHSTTAGYPTDLIADKLEEYTGLKGMDAFMLPKNINLNLGFIGNAEGTFLTELYFTK